MTIREALNNGFSLLQQGEIETPFLDAVVLLSDVLGISKEILFASYPETMDEENTARFLDHITSRLNGIPVSYIRKKKEFFGLEFYVDRRVLVPRPDTETIVETAIGLIDRTPSVQSVHDLCTGSGCIAIALKKTRPALYVTASDISGEALQVLRLNARNLLRNELPHYQSDLMKSVPGTFDMIVSNPPYLSEADMGVLRGKGWPEPESALYGGKNGLSVIEKLIAECIDSLRNDGYLLLEGGFDQAGKIKKLMESMSFSDIIIYKDLAGRDRVVSGRKS